ncbi:UNVERIFIED_CONTAM: TraB/GumN family protein, partial [Salmonella enterica subsp. enterica serovar Weltevreden]
SHLYGTLHSGDPRVLARAAALRARIADARLFMPELVTDAEAVSIYQAASVYGSDDLPRRVGRAKWPRIEKTLALHGVDPRVAV